MLFFIDAFYGLIPLSEQAPWDKFYYPIDKKSQGWHKARFREGYKYNYRNGCTSNSWVYM